MPAVDLTGPWRLVERHDGKIPAFEEPHLAVRVPGEVRQQLVDAGRLPDPFVEDNFVAQIALEANHWWLGRTFDADLEAGGPVWLVFEGIDCRSEVFLNGKTLGCFDGMYGGPAFDVTGLLAARNELLVHVLPAETQPELAAEFWKRGKIFEEDIAPAHRYVKQPALLCGKGFPPRVNTAGIWLPVRLERRGPADLADAWITVSSLAGDHSKAELILHAAAFTDGQKAIRAELIDANGHVAATVEASAEFVNGQASVSFTLERPALWWPNGEGDQHLYTLRVCAEAGPAIERRVGVRLARWVRTPGTDKTLTLEVNDRRIYAGGASWAGGDRTLRIDEEAYRWKLTLLRDAHTTFMRVWGGLPREPRFFYDLCDELGILERRIVQAREYALAGVDALHLADDLAMQDRLMVSTELFNQWLAPRYSRIIASARAVNPDILIHFHSDGKMDDLMPHSLAVGVDIFNPIQPECMDHKEMKRLYGDRCSFSGGLGVQSVLPHGTPEEVREHVRTTIENLGAGGGLIIGPAHIIERDIPYANFIAMVEAIDQFGNY